MNLCLSEKIDFPKGFFKEFRRAEIPNENFSNKTACAGDPAADCFKP